MKNKREVQGFTLIEILIVVFIISIVSGVALLTISHNENRQIELFTKELVDLLSLAEEQAILEPSVLGLLINQHALHFATYQEVNENKVINQEKKKQKKWVRLDDKILGKQSIPNNIQLSIQLDKNVDLNQQEEKKVSAPQIIISPNGELTPFELYIGKKSESPRYVIRGDVDGNITYHLLS